MEAGRQLTALQVDGLTVDRGPARVLDGMNFLVARGEVVAVRGPSGSGKSTLLGVLCGLVKPASGSVLVLGQEISAMSDSERSRVRLRDIGVVFQGDELLPELTIEDNITLPLRLARGRLTAQDATDVADLTGSLGLRHLLHRTPAQVSGGQLQRASVARALVHGPQVVLADEPTAALDDRAATSAMASLVAAARARAAAVVVVTHQDDVADLCDRTFSL